MIFDHLVIINYFRYLIEELNMRRSPCELCYFDQNLQVGQMVINLATIMLRSLLFINTTFSQKGP